MTGVIRRKIDTGKLDASAARAGDAAGGVLAPDRALRLALGRAAQTEMALALIVTGLREDFRSLAELLELTEPGMFFGVLEGRGEALGLMALAQPVLAGLIEHQTTGEISEHAQVSRKPTRIDAAMTMPLIDRIMDELEQALTGPEDAGAQDWARGYRYASYLDDPRPLGLLLDDRRYRVFRAEVALGSAARAGGIVLALPADLPQVLRRGALPIVDAKPAFSDDLRAVVMDAPARLEAVLTRLRLPLQAVSGWVPGILVPLPLARAAEMTLEAPRGRVLAQVRLGQCAGARAVRLNMDARAAQAEDAAPRVAAPPAVRAG